MHGTQILVLTDMQYSSNSLSIAPNLPRFKGVRWIIFQALHGWDGGYSFKNLVALNHVITVPCPIEGLYRCILNELESNRERNSYYIRFAEHISLTHNIQFPNSKECHTQKRKQLQKPIKQRKHYVELIDIEAKYMQILRTGQRKYTSRERR